MQLVQSVNMSKSSGKFVRPATSPRLARRALHSASAPHAALTSYRKVVLEVARRLWPDEKDELRFAMKDFVPPEDAEDELTGVELMECLEHHGLLGPQNFAFLVKTLKNMGRQDLAELFARPERFRWDRDSSSLAIARMPHSATKSAQALVPTRQTSFLGPFSSFRNLVLDMSRELNQEEVKQIRWLSQDFFQHGNRRSDEMTGLDLLHAMEDNNLLGPGNYSFLVDCLREIGRLDLVSVMEPPSLPTLHPSFGILAQLCMKRMEVFSLKRTQYVFGMNNLIATIDGVSKGAVRSSGGWFQRICDSLSPKAVEAHSSFIIEHLPKTLINMSLYMNMLLHAIEEYQRNGDSPEFAGHIASCETHLDVLLSLMEEIGWDALPRKRERIATSRQYHPVRQASYGAFSGLAELTLECSSNRERVQEETRKLSSVLSRLESVLRLSGCMWSLTSWMIALLQVAVRSPVCLDQHEGLFRVLVSRHKRAIANNCGILEAVLTKTRVGRRLLETFRAKTTISQREESSSIAAMVHTSITPMPVFVFVILLLSERPSLAPHDFEVIIRSLKEHVEEKKDTFCKINGTVTLMVLDGIFRNVESFRQTRMQELGQNCNTEELLTY